MFKPLKRRKGETWLRVAIRQARKYGLEREVRDAYQAERRGGVEPRVAAHHACYEWDVLDLAAEYRRV